MCNVSAVRSARKPVVRTFKVLSFPTARTPGKLTITVNGKPTEYAFDLLRGEVPGGVCLSLHKQGAAEPYHVRIAEDGSAACDCAGGTYRGKCKHADLARPLVCRLADLFA